MATLPLGQGICRAGVGVVHKWLKKLFKADFHALPKCSSSKPSAKSHVHSLYCTTCMGKARCLTCEVKKHTDHGTLIQAFKCSRESVLDTEKIKVCIDTTAIDIFRSNGRDVVYIHSRKQSNIDQLGAKCPCGAKLNSEKQDIKFCSLYCKARDEYQELDQENNDEEQQSEQTEDEYHDPHQSDESKNLEDDGVHVQQPEHNNQEEQNKEEKQEDEEEQIILDTGITSRLRQPLKKRKISRKQLHPMRAPLF